MTKSGARQTAQGRAAVGERADATTDERYMGRALQLALAGWGQTAPNPLVGAVVVQDGQIVGEGAHHQFGGPHAEIDALRDADARAQGATLYVTLEPCAHHGKTPPCTDAIVAAGIAEVVAATPDPNPAAGGGASRLREHGIIVRFGPLETEARELNAAFFHAFASEHPWVTLKLATSLDGAIADYARAPGWLTNEDSRREAHRLRAGHDAVGVGLGTVMADDPQLTVRAVAPPRQPATRVVFARHGRLPLTSRLAQSVHEAPVVVIAESIEASYEHALGELGVDVVVAPTLAEGLRGLRQRGIRSLLVEGGARLAAALLTQRLVHRLVVFQAPIILGAGALNAFASLPGLTVAGAPRFRVIRRAAFGDDLLTTYAVREG